MPTVAAVAPATAAAWVGSGRCASTTTAGSQRSRPPWSRFEPFAQLLQRPLQPRSHRADRAAGPSGDRVGVEVLEEPQHHRRAIRLVERQHGVDQFAVGVQPFGQLCR